MAKSFIRNYIKNEFLCEFDEVLTEDDDLFKAGILDSFGYIKMIKSLEKEFGIEFLESELMSVEVSLSEIVKKITGKIEGQTLA